MIASSFLKDLISAGHLSPESSYLAVDPGKLVRARKKEMCKARQGGNNKPTGIEGIGYDGRRDKHTRAMVPDKSTGKEKMRNIVEEHESVTAEPSGKYLGHFTPKPPSNNEKPALTSLRILKTQPKVVQDTITFYIRKNAWYAHPECLLLSLVSSSAPEDRQFAVSQILKLRAGKEYGDNSVRPRITPKLNLSATNLIDLISWNPKEVQEPSFTCSRSTAEIESYLDSPFISPKFSCHTQSTERYCLHSQDPI